MPPAASGSESPRGKTARKAPAEGPKRTPRPDSSTNGKAAPLGKSGDSDRAEQSPGLRSPFVPASDDLTAGDHDYSADTDTDTDTVPAVSPGAVEDPTVVGAPPPPPPTAVAAPERERRNRPGPQNDTVDTGRRKGRRVRRVIRRIDLWSVLKLAIVLYTCLYAAVMATLALLWGLAYSSGQIEKVQSFMADVGMDNYRFYGDQMWRACAMIGAIGVLAATVITVLTAALVNVISEMTGGIRVVVIEEDPPPRRR